MIRKLWASFYKKTLKDESGSSILELALVLLIVGLIMSGVIHKGRQMLDHARFQKVIGELSHFSQDISQIMTQYPDLSWKDSNSWQFLSPFQGAAPLSQEAGAPPILSNGFSLSVETIHHKKYLIAGIATDNNVPPKGFTATQARMCQDNLPQHVDIVDSQGHVVTALDNKKGYALRIEL